MKLLNAVFSYNRYHLLRNTVESLFEFGPAGDLLIVDDGSEEPEVVAYLNSLEAERKAVVSRSDTHDAESHGGLYTNMNKAVDHALKNNYSHIFFIQDDVQFMWKDDRFLDRVEQLMTQCPDAAMAIPLFFKGIVAPSLPGRLESNEQARCWHLRPYGITDMGIMQTKLLAEKKWRFRSTESENGRAWREWGYKAYVMSTPTLAWVPWPEVKVGRLTFGEKRAAPKKYFLKPLEPQQIEQLKGADLHTLPFHEDYCWPWGWTCWSPYWFTKGRREYFQLLWKQKKWPRRVGVR